MSIHIRIFGRVQGVGYRAWAVHTAQALKLTGFVRNRRDGSVEVWADGDINALNAFLDRCHQGPVFARVDEVHPMSHPDAPMPSLDNTFFSSRTV